MHALIIEDEWLTALSLEEYLRSLGFDSTAVAATEDAAVAEAAEHWPDLVLADVRLRAGNGVAAVRHITRRMRVPVVFVTASRDQLTEIAGAVVVEKPFFPSELGRALVQAGALPSGY